MTVTKTETITIGERSVDIEVTAPDPLEFQFCLRPKLPEAFDPDRITDAEDFGEMLTPEEIGTMAKAIVRHTTDLPEEIIEELATEPLTRLASTGGDVIEEEYADLAE